MAKNEERQLLHIQLARHTKAHAHHLAVERTLEKVTRRTPFLFVPPRNVIVAVLLLLLAVVGW